MTIICLKFSKHHPILVIFISDNERFHKTILLERFEKNLGNYINQIRIINPLDTEDIHNEVKEYISSVSRGLIILI